jgi:hypothetical protein
MPKTKITGRYIVAWDGSHPQIPDSGEVVFEKDTILFTGFDYPGPVEQTIEADETC